eukprot:CAMPEP_0177324838 /NCGR_PEP_ID=MMETSP0368-20130122/17486_1 /TAXON_ID=447022 ORGANISM="Scrippsiella hangoei-like, Strain SHHI-4" /NCGR_SAMPLE_ID=MMETSP0368 /ASSEMBLY_ACC=CAM_ASM_000363 /LENGTH=99 /DNA_ID=CAMNT_0018784691 /DNA_START=15 /DNA_END=310 /DNA_ORIENTATION=-
MPGGAGSANRAENPDTCQPSQTEPPHSKEQHHPARGGLLDRLEEDLVLLDEAAVAEANCDHVPVEEADLEGLLILGLTGVVHCLGQLGEQHLQLVPNGT